MKETKKKPLVFVGLSGGVDSAVSAALLLKAEYEVVGVFIKTWHPEIFPCNEEEERLDAMRICAHLGIPFLTFDLENVYKKEVADYMIREYKAGRTPNPDVMCNKEVKFGAFLKKALSMGADYVATGHYARLDGLSKNSSLYPQAGSDTSSFLLNPPRLGTPSKKHFLLRKGTDPAKDQSYFLWTLTQRQLSKIIFPIGNLKKTEVRKQALKFKLPVATKKDSQGICFLGAIDLKEFLKHYIKPKKGKVYNTKGEEIGHHDGAVFYTLGERHGFVITKKGPSDGAYYVVGKDIKKNILIVSQNPLPNLSPSTNGEGRRGEVIKITNTNWISEIPKENKTYTAQIRYHGEFLPCKIVCESRTSAKVTFKKPTLVASGQSIVVYDKDVCLGGGVVI